MVVALVVVVVAVVVVVVIVVAVSTKEVWAVVVRQRMQGKRTRSEMI